MRVLFINTLYSPYSFGGAEKSVQSLAENLVLSGVEVGVITLGEKTRYFDLNGVKIWCLQIQNKYWPFSKEVKSKKDKFIWHLKDVNNKSYTKDLNKIITSFKPALIHTHNLSGFSVNVWSIAQKINIKTIHTLRDYYLQCPSATKFKDGSICTKACIDCYFLSIKKKSASQNVACVVGISKFILKDHIKLGYFLQSQQKVIYNGFQIELGKEKRKDIEEEGEIIFGFIGQINASKGIEILLESFNNLREHKNWSLIIAGRITNNYKSKLLKICPSNRIEFLGFVESKAFFRKIDVLVVPSIWNEPFGRVVIEGIINRKVVLASQVGGITELLENNHGFTFMPTCKELTSVLKSFLNNPHKLKTFKIEPSFLLRFHIEKTASSYISLYKSIIEK